MVLDHFFFYLKNFHGISYNKGAKYSFRGNMTKKLSKSQALAYLNKAKTYTVRSAGVQYINS